jgi:hypothetical protein
MLECLIVIGAIFGLAFALKQTDGPWDLVSRWRNWMMRVPFIGVQFYKLLDCYFCIGWWSGLAIYFLTQESYKLNWAICWGLAGGTLCLVIDGIISKLHQ